MVISAARIWKTFASGLLFVVVINIVFQLGLTWRQFDHLLRAEPWLVLLAAVNQLIAHAVIVPAMGAFYDRSGIRLTRWRLFAMASAALATSRVLPGGDYAVWRLSLRKVPGAAAATTQWYVLYLAATLLVLGGMFTFFELVVLFSLPIAGGAQVLANLRFLPFVAGLLLLGIVVLLRIPRVRLFVARVAMERMPKRALSPLGIIRERHIGGKGVLMIILAAATSWLVEGYTFALCLAAIGLHLPLILALAAFGFARLISNIPVSPGGVGEMEAGAVLFLGVYGHGADSVLTATLIYRLITYWPPLLIGGVAYALAGHHGDDQLLKLRSGLTAESVHRRLRRRSLSVR